MFFLGIVLWSTVLAAQPGFLASQLNHGRVATAKKEKDEWLREEFERRGWNYDQGPKNVYLRAFKEELILEVWVQYEHNQDYYKFCDYSICKASGKLGPKSKRGDEQVPEGFYYINEFNPNSNFYLSLGINYPNTSDRQRSKSGNLGGDIYIHGDCFSIGCLAMTNEKIKEIYWLCAKARENGQTYIPVHIFPYKFDITTPFLYEHDKQDEELHRFWHVLEEAYSYFIYKRRPPFVHIDENGNYSFY